MKKLFLILLVLSFFASCKTTKVATPNTTNNTTTDTAMGGDRMKNPVKP